MKQLIIFSLFVFVVRVVYAQPTAPVDKVWVPVTELSDEFNGTELDNSKWLPYLPYWTGRFPSYFDSTNVSMANGNLMLKATVANYDQTGAWIKTCCVSSKTTSMKVGYYSEARIKCPTLSLSGSFWFQGKYSEIDVIENFGAPASPKYAGHERHMKTNVHYFKNGWDKDVAYPWWGNILPTSCADSYYTYGVWWKDNKTIIFYLDGKAVRTTNIDHEFNEDMYMFFDIEAFTWAGLPSISCLDNPAKNTHYVDYVRTYSLVN